jgi:FkbM family methyltransferase
MSAGVKRFLRSIVTGRIAEGARRVTELCDPFVLLSYSQDGEDMILRRMFENRRAGFYVDVGAHDPFRFSNTCYFHRRGWRGVNIDASPAAIAAFERSRPADTNICSGIAETPGKLTFHRFNEPALNTFDPALAAARAALPGYWLLDRTEVDVRRLDDVLSSHVPAGQTIDFLSVDVEGFDLEVLRSNDWDRFRPKALLVEARDAELGQLPDDPACAFAQSVGYSPVAKTVNTVIFVEEKSA